MHVEFQHAPCWRPVSPQIARWGILLGTGDKDMGDEWTEVLLLLCVPAALPDVVLDGKQLHMVVAPQKVFGVFALVELPG